MLEMFKSLWTDESGQGLAEYAVLITLIAIVLFAAIVAFREAIINVLDGCGWNTQTALKILQISRATLWRKMKKYEIVYPVEKK